MRPFASAHLLRFTGWGSVVSPSCLCANNSPKTVPPCCVVEEESLAKRLVISSKGTSMQSQLIDVDVVSSGAASLTRQTNVKPDRFFYTAAGAIFLVLTVIGFQHYIFGGRHVDGSPIDPSMLAAVVAHS